MIRVSRYIVLAVFMISFMTLSFATNSWAELTRELVLELDPVEGAVAYDVKVETLDQPSSPPKITKINRPEYVAVLPLGRYRISARSLDRRNVPGQWQEIGEVDVLFKAPTWTSPTNMNQTFVLESGKKQVEMPVKWTQFHPLAEYELQVLDESQKVIQNRVVTGDSDKFELPVGSFTVILKSRPPDQKKIDGTDPPPITVVVRNKKLSDPRLAKPEKIPPSQISWSKVKNAEKYRVRLLMTKNEIGTVTDPPKVILETETNQTTIDIPPGLAPGSYRLYVQAFAGGADPSRDRFIGWRIAPQKPVVGSKAPKKGILSPKDDINMNYVSASVGPSFWQYQFIQDDKLNSFDLVAMTLTSVEADSVFWFNKKSASPIGIEIKGRQTNLYLFENGEGADIGQEPVTVADRRVAVMLRYRHAFRSWSLDGMIGFGTHRYTYLLQDGAQKVIVPYEGDLREYYFGGATDHRFTGGHRFSADFSYHPVSTSKAIDVKSTRQYTLGLKYLRSLIQGSAYLTAGLENYRSSITLNSPYFEGEATTVSNWYRFALGVALSY